MSYPAPGWPITHTGWKMTGRTAGRNFLSNPNSATLRPRSRRAYSLDLAAVAAGRPLTLSSAEVVSFALTPRMYGFLRGTGGEDHGDFVVSSPPVWPSSGLPARPPARSVVIVANFTYGHGWGTESDLADLITASLGARLEAAGVWCGLFHDAANGPSAGEVTCPGLWGLPGTSILNVNETALDAAYHVYDPTAQHEEDVPVVDSGKWKGREALLIYAMDVTQNYPAPYGFFGAYPSGAYGGYNYYTYTSTKAACLAALAATFAPAAPIFLRSQLGIVSVTRPVTGGGGAPLYVEANAHLSDAATAAGGWHEDLPEGSLADVAAEIVTRITSFYGDV